MLDRVRIEEAEKGALLVEKCAGNISLRAAGHADDAQPRRDVADDVHHTLEGVQEGVREGVQEGVMRVVSLSARCRVMVTTCSNFSSSSSSLTS